MNRHCAIRYCNSPRLLADHFKKRWVMPLRVVTASAPPNACPGPSDWVFGPCSRAEPLGGIYTVSWQNWESVSQATSWLRHRLLLTTWDLRLVGHSALAGHQLGPMAAHSRALYCLIPLVMVARDTNRLMKPTPHPIRYTCGPRRRPSVSQLAHGTELPTRWMKKPSSSRTSTAREDINPWIDAKILPADRKKLTS